jgi:hypothetical protein
MLKLCHCLSVLLFIMSVMGLDTSELVSVNCKVVACCHGFFLFMFELPYFTSVDDNVENGRPHSCVNVVVLHYSAHILLP